MVKTTAFCLVVTITILSVLIALNIAVPRDVPVPSLAVAASDALVFAPLVENIVFILVCEFLLAFRLRRTTVVLIVALLSALLHALVADWRAVAGFVTFAVMTYSYLLWSERLFSARYFLTVAQHVLFNTPSILAIAWTSIG